jgi:hypothetical protein
MSVSLQVQVTSGVCQGSGGFLTVSEVCQSVFSYRSLFDSFSGLMSVRLQIQFLTVFLDYVSPSPGTVTWSTVCHGMVQVIS